MLPYLLNNSFLLLNPNVHLLPLIPHHAHNTIAPIMTIVYVYDVYVYLIIVFVCFIPFASPVLPCIVVSSAISLAFVLPSTLYTAQALAHIWGPSADTVAAHTLIHSAVR